MSRKRCEFGHFTNFAKLSNFTNFTKFTNFLRFTSDCEFIASSINYEIWSFEYYELAHAAQYKYSKIYWHARLQIHKFARSAIIG